MNGAVFKTVSETVRTGSGRFDSYTPPPAGIGGSGLQTRPDFVSKMGTVEEEADETIYWMELLIDAEIVKRARIADLLDEADQILSLVISSIKTAKGIRANPQSAISNQKSYA